MSEITPSGPSIPSSGVSEAFLQPNLVLNGKWEILGHIASGGKGEVYRAHQISLERIVALKVLSPDFVDSFRDNPEELESEKERFRREVRVMAGIRHPNVLQVFDYDAAQLGDTAIEYLVMEFIPGSTLRATMPQEGFGVDATRISAWLKEYFLPVLDGVSAIHSAGIIHRDIKPENILLDGAVPKIADFGLARVLHQPGLTNTFHILGTIFYMPKQQFEDGADVDARADVYALGKILYEAIAGKITNASKVVFKEVGLNPDAAGGYGEDFFVYLNSIIRCATREEAEGRTISAKAMADALRSALTVTENDSGQIAPPTREKKLRTLYISAITLLIILISVVLFHFSREADERSKVNGIANSGGQMIIAPEGQPAKRVQTDDGAMLELMPSAVKKWLPMRSSREEVTNVAAFYAENSLVSNRRFVAYLNAVKDDLVVGDNTVSLKGTVIFMLGEIREGYEPIIYENGEFRLNVQTAAADPVVRVSGEGALAYARHYGRELPGTAQWLTVKQQGLVPGGAMPKIKEWGVDKIQSGEQFYVFESSPEDSTVFCPLPRRAWEAFENVGFRTVLPAIREAAL